MTKRRTLLAAIGGSGLVLTAGCLGETVGDGETFPGISIDPDEYESDEAKVTAEVVREFDEDHPARIRIAYRNESSEVRGVAFGATRPISSYMGSYVPDGEERLGLYPTNIDSKPPEEPRDECWQLRRNEVPGTASFPFPMELGPGESVESAYDVFAVDPDDTEDGTFDCLPEGEYRFGQQTFGGQDRGWGFSLYLTDG